MNMYVSNLSFHTGDDDLKKLFEQFGAVSSAKVINDRETGRSRGFGFVEMGSDEEANQAIKGLNGKDIDGRSMSVSVAKEKPARSDNKRW
ncbi:MAG: RNA-binding protein [Chitinophagaceae bacterium]|nr:RNA-binding protein [Chitinophagaceae bacterium]MBK9380495.1 RNA-binding protein [Chitinophagaceae bacterium]MBL0306738.1 RNA-binding protein [Chitinophagaceae bacterium]HQV60184.1 RNA-binding protein [Chitinophagaceae bacterium]HQV85335.1 RNA-binding protein [Chitinophagaceae bacterium]